MKIIIHILCLTLFPLINSHASPNIAKMLQELKETNSISESLDIRNKYLKEAKNLHDFYLVTRLEPLESSSEGYYTDYKYALLNMIANNISAFMTTDKLEKKFYIKYIYEQAKGTNLDYRFAEIGLNYIKQCREFQAYTIQTNRYLIDMYYYYFCPYSYF